jgi:diguanylate cyclase (GGDEF)-like protein
MTATVDVLVIDDDPAVPLLIDETLAGPDRLVHYVHSGADALRALRRITPAVILLDVDLGDMSGFEVASLCRENERLSGVPIVFITGRAYDDASMSAGYGLGAIDYLWKPIVLPVLASKVSALCTLAHQNRLISEQRDQLQAARDSLERANARLTRLASSDPLTGLANRRELERSLATLRSRQIRTAEFLAVILLDLDGFKEVNDCHGHQAGDEVLTEAGRRMLTSIRACDVVARVGGDEFVIAFAYIEGGQEPLRAVNRLRDVLASPYRVGQGVSVTAPASIGMVEVRPGATAVVSEILAAADAAMYSSKSDPERAIVHVVIG